MPLISTVSGPVTTLVLNRPELRNALSEELCDAISAGLAAIEEDAAARVLVLRGEGSVFCSGADFAAVSGPGAASFVASFERMLEALARFRLPTVAAIHGAALGGGLQLATVCDFRVAADDAKLGIPSSRLGIVVNFENVERLVLLAGVAVAKEVLLTGRTYSGAEAVAAGLVHRSAAPDRVVAEAEALAGEIAGRAPLSVQGGKAAIQAVMDNLGGTRTASSDRVAEIDALVTRAYESQDLVEGLRALTERRDPRFEGH
jgi:enoyl-CoA hydratase